MNTFNFLNLHVSTENSFNELSLSEATLIRGTSSTQSPPNLKLNAVVLLTAFGSVFAWKIIVLSLSIASKVLLKRKVQSDRFKPVPCRNCQFFTNIHYLKCAVHPNTALTRQALNCPDYQSGDQVRLRKLNTL